VEVLVRVGETIMVANGVNSTVWLEVHGELQAGELVITSGHATLVDGSRVKERLSVDPEGPRS
jgi:hypothetical protein